MSSKKRKKSFVSTEHGKPSGFSTEVVDILDQLERDREAGTPIETAVGPLRESLRGSPAIYRELVEALVARATEWSAPVLHLLLQEAVDKEGRKRVKRALYRLQQKGFVWQEPTAKEESIWKPPPAPKTFCRLSKLYPDGDRIVFLFLPVGIGKYIMMEAAISDREGLLDYRNGVFQGSNISKVLEEFTQERQKDFIDTDPAHCRFLLEEARDISLGKGEALSEEFLEDMRIVVQRFPEMDIHPLYLRVDRDEVAGNPHLLKEAIGSMEDKSSIIGIIDRSILGPYLQEYTTAAESRIVLSKFQEAARKEEIYRQAAADIFSRAEERQRMRRRLEEAGYLLWEKGFQKEARACAAAAMELETASSGPVPSPLAGEGQGEGLVYGGHSPPYTLLIAMVRHSLEFHRYFDLKEEKEEHPLLIRPSLLKERRARL